jgi:dihydropteroate synthase
MTWNDKERPPLIMGVLNLTPDSFSDGGRFLDPELAVNHARRMWAEGADIIDIGGESTRPGASAQSARIQIERVVPVIRALRECLSDESPMQPMLIIDTRSAEVAEVALDAGADLINDVSAGRDSMDMFALAAERAVPIVLMHMQGSPQSMQRQPHYDDVLAEVEAFLLERAEAARAAGVAAGRILLDPGIGFGKRREDNLALLAGLPRLAKLGYPLLLGTSRKRFMGSLCEETEPTELLGATCATTALGTAAGVRVFRVHDVKANRQAVTVAWAVSRMGG